MKKTKPHIHPALSIASALLATSVAVVWGFNFIMVKIGLDEIPPLTFCALRFFFASIPAVFFIKKPNTLWRYIIGYGLLTFAVQFSLLFFGMAIGVSPGIAALIVQLQVFFAIFFAFLLVNQPVGRWQILGAMISFLGIIVIGLHRSGNLPAVGFMVIILGALSWGLGSVIATKFKDINMIALVVWSSFVAFFPLVVLSFIFEDPRSIILHPSELSWSAIIALAYVTYISTHFGYGCWSWLLSQYSMASIAPFALLCPIIALMFSTLMLGESFESWKMFATILVLAGLSLNIFGKQLVRFLEKPSQKSV
jgi:O-acetylserine/cysteine efflux transporter